MTISDRQPKCAAKLSVSKRANNHDIEQQIRPQARVLCRRAVAAVPELTPTRRGSRPIHGNASLLSVTGVIAGLARVAVDAGAVRDHGSHRTGILCMRTERVAV